jgi:hypothetical protein
MDKPNTISIDNVEYVRKDSLQVPEVKGDYVIVRCHKAGVHAGYLAGRDSETVSLKNSRRLWRWWSKFSLSGLAMSGILKGKESECRFACVLPEITLMAHDVCEIIPATESARVSIESQEEHTNE